MGDPEPCRRAFDVSDTDFRLSAKRKMFDSGPVCSERGAGGIVANVATPSSRGRSSAQMHGLTPNNIGEIAA
jgi:hypothetical protein